MFAPFPVSASRGAGRRRSHTGLHALSVLIPTLLAAVPGMLSSAAHAAMTAHVPGSAASAVAISAVSSSQVISLTLALPLRNKAAAQDLQRRIYDPSDPLYGKYLTTADFISQFAPTQADYDAVASYYQSLGFQIANRQPNRLLLNVQAPASVVQAVFGVNLGNFQRADGSVFFAADRAPSVPAPAGVAISAVLGLDNAYKFKPHYVVGSHVLKASSVTPNLGTGPGGALAPADIKTAYNMNSITQTGQGQVLALMELDGYSASDITTYESQFGLPNVPLQNIFVDGFDGTPGDGSLEVVLDIDMQAALAPNISKIQVYQASNSLINGLDVYNQIANDNVAKSISTSWGVPELVTSELGLTDTENFIFLQMSLQGQSIFAAAGDSGAFDDGSGLSVDDPASQPNMTAVGGTELGLNPDGTYAFENAWADPSDTRRSPFGFGGGGGISALWAKPSFQKGFGLSTTMRNVPDVCLNADLRTGYAICLNGQWLEGGVGGTSAAAPLWSAFAALVNQKRVANGSSTLGLITPRLYPIAASANYNSNFFDPNNGTTNLFYATTNGYDNATGLGSFNAANLLKTLTDAPNAPTGVAAAPGAGQVTLTWNATAKATSYSVKRSTKAGGPYITISNVPATSYVDTAVVNGTKYYYVVTASSNGGESSNSAEVSATPTAAPSVVLSGLNLAASTIYSGQRTTGTVTLAAPAPTGGVAIRLTSTNPSAATVFPAVSLPAGATSATFPIATPLSLSLSQTLITATLNSTTLTAPLTVNLADGPGQVTIDPGSVFGGARSVGTVTLLIPAPAGGQVVTLTSNKPSAIVYPSITVPAGSTTATFPIATTTDLNDQVTTITASANTRSANAQIVVKGVPNLAAISLSAPSIPAGTRSSGTVTLTSVAPPGGVTVNLNSSTSAIVVYPSIVVPAGSNSTTFPIATFAGTAATGAVITATLRDISKSAGEDVTLPVVLTGFSIAPSSVTAGASATGTVTLSAISPSSVYVTLVSNVSGVKVVSSVAIPAGSLSATFPITTKAGMIPATATITATYGSVSKPATLKVTAATSAN